MHVEDQCGIFKRIVKLAKEQEKVEHGALIIGKSVKTSEEGKVYCLTDYCMINEVGGVEQEGHVRIPTKLSYVFLRDCNVKKNIPVIIHTHPVVYNEKKIMEVSFSPPDIRFIEKFSAYAQKLGDIEECLFIVTDGESIEYCKCDLSSMNYVYEKDKVKKYD